MFDNHKRVTAKGRENGRGWTSHGCALQTGQMSDLEPPPEALLVERLRTAARPKLSIRAAADAAGISDARWRQIAKGYNQASKDVRVPARAPADTLARMAKAVGATPDQLREVGRADAAEELQALPSTQSITGVGVRPAIGMEAAGRDGAREPGGLGRGLKYLIPTTDGMSPEEREEALEDERAVLESTWSAATEITESVLESGPSDRLRAATQRVVFLLSAQVIMRILGSGYAPALESWLERVYRERQILHERLGDSPTPWVQDGINPEDAARSAVQTFGQWPAYFQPPSSGASVQAAEGEEGDRPGEPLDGTDDWLNDGDDDATTSAS